MNTAHLVAVRNWSEQSDYVVVTPSFHAKTMFYYIQEIGHFYTLSGYSTERKHLDSFLVAYTVSGKCRLTYRGRQYTLTAGQAFFIHCEDYQYYETDPDDLWQVYWVHFNGGASRSYFEICMHNSGPVFELGVDSIIPHLINRMLDLYRNRDARTEALVSKTIVDLLTEMLLFSMNTAKQPGLVYLPDYVQVTANYLEEHYAGKITLDELASAAAVSKYHLARQFKKYTGSTPNEYLMHTRMSAAKELLQSSDMSIGQVAISTGFDNVSHFINAFKRHEKLTPLSFRKRWRK